MLHFVALFSVSHRNQITSLEMSLFNIVHNAGESLSTESGTVISALFPSLSWEYYISQLLDQFALMASQTSPVVSQLPCSLFFERI